MSQIRNKNTDCRKNDIQKSTKAKKSYKKNKIRYKIE
jgi:hypothetical protein